MPRAPSKRARQAGLGGRLGKGVGTPCKRVPRCRLRTARGKSLNTHYEARMPTDELVKCHTCWWSKWCGRRTWRRLRRSPAGTHSRIPGTTAGHVRRKGWAIAHTRTRTCRRTMQQPFVHWARPKSLHLARHLEGAIAYQTRCCRLIWRAIRSCRKTYVATQKATAPKSATATLLTLLCYSCTIPSWKDCPCSDRFAEDGLPRVPRL